MAVLCAFAGLAAAGCSGGGSTDNAATGTTSATDAEGESADSGDRATASITSSDGSNAPDRSDGSATGGGLPIAIWGIEDTTFDLIEVDSATGAVMKRIPGWGAELADSNREGGPQTLTDVEMVGDALWVADCCEPAAGNVFRVDPTRDSPVPDSPVTVNGTDPVGSPDGSRLAVQILDLGVAIVDATTGQFLVDPSLVRDVLAPPPGAAEPYFAKPLSWVDNSTLAISISTDRQSAITFVSITNPAAPAAVGATIQVPGTVVDGATRGEGSLVLAVLNPDRNQVDGMVLDPETGSEDAAFELPIETEALGYDQTGTYLLVSRRDLGPVWLGAGQSGTIDAPVFGATWSSSLALTRGPEASTAPVVDSFEPTDVGQAGLEGIGCWFYRNGDELDTVFHGGWEATFMIIDGRQVVGAADGFWAIDDVVTTDGYQIRFTDVGEPVAASIESQIQPATLVVTPTDSERPRTLVEGELWCGV
ncbi:MAG: hypothetical protein WBM50_22545 [Acidimicrobiales bacterium]